MTSIKEQEIANLKLEATVQQKQTRVLELQIELEKRKRRHFTMKAISDVLSVAALALWIVFLTLL